MNTKEKEVRPIEEVMAENSNKLYHLCMVVLNITAMIAYFICVPFIVFVCFRFVGIFFGFGVLIMAVLFTILIISEAAKNFVGSQMYKSIIALSKK